MYMLKIENINIFNIIYINVQSCRCRRKEERSKKGQTNNEAKQHYTPKVVTFPKKHELPRVGLEPTSIL